MRTTAYRVSSTWTWGARQRRRTWRRHICRSGCTCWRPDWILSKQGIPPPTSSLSLSLVSFLPGTARRRPVQTDAILAINVYMLHSHRSDYRIHRVRRVPNCASEFKVLTEKKSRSRFFLRPVIFSILFIDRYRDYRRRISTAPRCDSYYRVRPVFPRFFRSP